MGGKQRGGKPLYRWRRRGEAGRCTESHRGLRSWFPSQVWDYRHMCVGEGRTPILLCLKTVAPNGLSSTNSRPEDRGSVSSVRFLFSSRIPPPAPHTYPKHKYWISRAHRQLRNLCAKCPGGPAWLGWPSLACKVPDVRPRGHLPAGTCVSLGCWIPVSQTVASWRNLGGQSEDECDGLRGDHPDLAQSAEQFLGRRWSLCVTFL